MKLYQTRKIIEEWCNECQKTASYSASNKYNMVTLYTTHPGYFIGVKGTLIEKYRNKLCEIGWETVTIQELTQVVYPRRDKKNK